MTRFLTLLVALLATSAACAQDDFPFDVTEITSFDDSADGEPEITQDFLLTCNGYGTNLSFSLLRDNKPVSSGEFVIDSVVVKDDDIPYDLNEGYVSTMTWTMDHIHATCENVTSYDSNDYKCVATNKDPDGNDRQETSDSIAVKARCS